MSNNFRFYADGKGRSSAFSGVFTAIRDLATDDLDACPNGEYDCDDATCISDDLICNSVRYVVLYMCNVHCMCTVYTAHITLYIVKLYN